MYTTYVELEDREALISIYGIDCLLERELNFANRVELMALRKKFEDAHKEIRQMEYGQD